MRTWLLVSIIVLVLLTACVGTVPALIPMSAAPQPSATLEQPTVTPAPTETATPKPFSLPVQLGTPLPDLAGPLSPDNAALIQELAAYGEGRLFAATFSPQGDILAVSRENGVDILDTAGLTRRCRFTRSRADYLAFNSSGDRLVIAVNFNNIVQIIDPTTCKLDRQEDLTALSDVGKNPQIYYISPDGSALVFGSNSGNVCRTNTKSPAFWITNPLSNSAVPLLPNLACSQFPGSMYLYLSPNLKTIYIPSYSSDLEAWDKASATLALKFPKAGNVVAVSSDNQWVATANGNMLKLWTAAGKMTWQVKLKDSVFQLKFTSDGVLLAVTTSGLTLIDSKDGSPISTLFENDWISIFTLDPTHAQAATFSTQGLDLWDLTNKTRTASRKDYFDISFRTVIDPTNNLVGLTFENAFGVLDLTKGTIIQMQANGGSLSFSPDGSRLATATSDHMLEVFSVPDFTLLTVPQVNADGVAFSPDGKTLAVDGSNGKISLLDTSTWKVNTVFKSEPSSWFGYSPDGQWLYAQSGNNLKIWNTSDNSLKLKLTNPGGIDVMNTSKSDPTFLPGGETFLWNTGDPIYCCKDKLTIYNILNGKVADTLPTNPNYWFDFPTTLSPDGRLLAALVYEHGLSGGSHRGYVLQFWDWQARKMLASLPMTQFMLRDMRFSADGRYLVIVNEDGIIRVFGVVK